jgi:pimeloyl-ACP methyl ester carboxylesterase
MIDRLGGREEANDDLGSRDLLRITRTLTTPTLIVHGSTDSVIPVSHAREFSAHLNKLKAPHQYIEVKNAGHCPLLTEEGIPLAEIVAKFLTEN